MSFISTDLIFYTMRRLVSMFWGHSGEGNKTSRDTDQKLNCRILISCQKPHCRLIFIYCTQVIFDSFCLADMETECFPAVSMASATGQPDFPEDVLIKQEPPSPPPASPPRAHTMSTISTLLSAPSPPLSSASSISSLHPQSLLKQPTIVLAARTPALHAAASTSTRDHQMLYPKVNIKVEPQMSSK